MPFRNWRYRNIRRGRCQLYTNGCGCIITLFCTNVALVKREAQMAAPSRAELPSKQEGWQPPCRECEPFGGVSPAYRAGHPLPEHKLRHCGTQGPPQGSHQGEDRSCTYKATLRMSAWNGSWVLLGHLSVQTQDPFSPGHIRSGSGVNGIIHVPKSPCTHKLFLWQ